MSAALLNWKLPSGAEKDSRQTREYQRKGCEAGTQQNKIKLMMEQDFGVCRLSAVPILNEPGISVQNSQLLFGDAYEVLDRSKDKLWLRIRLNFDMTEGWINLHHHHSIPQEYFFQII